ncbi:MAG: hypothetical protein ACKVRO_01805 [Micropepsaceae bacterium]
MQIDPVGYNDQVNLYAYGNSDPVNSSDASGCVVVVEGTNDQKEEFRRKAEGYTGLPLDYWPDTGVLRITGPRDSARGNAEAAAWLTAAINAPQSLPFKMVTNDPQTNFDAFHTDAFDLGDFSVAEGKSRDWAAALFTHIVVERLTAAQVARSNGGSYYDYWKVAHEEALKVESRMLGAAYRRDNTKLVSATGPDFYRLRNGPLFFEYYDRNGRFLKQYVVTFKDGVMH